MKKLYLSDDDRKMDGVCGVIGEYFERDSTVIRIPFIIRTLSLFGFGVIAYLAMCSKETSLHMTRQNAGSSYS